MPLSKASLEQLVEASPDIVIATDAEGTVAYYNDGAQETLGYARDQIIGQFVTHLYPSSEEAKRVMAAMRGASYGGTSRIVNFPTRFVAKDRHEIPVAISGVILYDGDRREQGTIGFAKDLSEIIRKDKLALLGEVAVGLSHEINNPLEVITNEFTLLERFLREGGDGPEVRRECERIEKVRHEVRRIEENLQRLVQMSHGEDYMTTSYLGDARMVDLSRPLAAPLAGVRVLVVDDDEAVRGSVAELLEAEKCRVGTAADGQAALTKLAQEPFDILLSDVVMPGMDGYELFQQVKQTYPGVHVILMTAFYHDRDHVIKRSRLKGLEGVLFKKPVEPSRLLQMIATMVSPARSAPSSG